MAARNEASACCAGVFTSESQLWPSLPCKIRVAGRAPCPYTSSTTIWQSQWVVPWCGHGQSAIPRRASRRSKVCSTLRPRRDRQRLIQCTVELQECSTDQKGMTVFMERITLDLIIGTRHAALKR